MASVVGSTDFDECLGLGSATMKDSQEKVPLSPLLVCRLEIALACGVVLELSENLHLKCLPLGRHATRANYGCHYYPVGNEKLDAFICYLLRNDSTGFS